MGGFQVVFLTSSFHTFVAFILIFAFALLRRRPVYRYVYYPKLTLKGIRNTRFSDLLPDALRMSENELIKRVGLDSVAHIRLYLLGLKIFGPLAIVGNLVLAPINWTAEPFADSKDFTSSDIDSLSISNIPFGSKRFWAHIVASYVYLFWVCNEIYKESVYMVSSRSGFLASKKRSLGRFTVFVRNVPPERNESLNNRIENYFRTEYATDYLTHQVVYKTDKLAKLLAKKKTLQNKLLYYRKKQEKEPTKKLYAKVVAERERIKSDPMDAAFVLFKSAWGAAACIDQNSNSKNWLIEWAPEPRDILWKNTTIPSVQIHCRKFLMGVCLSCLLVFSTVPLAFVLGLGNSKVIKALPFPRPLMEMNIVMSYMQGLLPIGALKAFFYVIPKLLICMSKIEGFPSLSFLERRVAGKYNLFILVSVFALSIDATGAGWQQLHNFFHGSLAKIPQFLGESILKNSTFFILYVIVDGLTGLATEVLRFIPIFKFHMNAILFKTDQDSGQAMDPDHLDFSSWEPKIQLFFMIGFLYGVITPYVLLFLYLYFAFGYGVFRYQIIHVYEQKFDTGALFFPDVIRRLVIAIIISQLVLMELLRIRGAENSTMFLIPLPLLTIGFYFFCRRQFMSSFVKYQKKGAMANDTLGNPDKPDPIFISLLQYSYTHPLMRNTGSHQQERPTSSNSEDPRLRKHFRRSYSI